MNDLNQFLISRSVNGLSVDVDTPEIQHYLKLLILLYADDRVLFGTSPKDLLEAVISDLLSPLFFSHDRPFQIRLVTEYWKFGLLLRVLRDLAISILC